MFIEMRCISTPWFPCKGGMFVICKQMFHGRAMNRPTTNLLKIREIREICDNQRFRQPTTKPNQSRL